MLPASTRPFCILCLNGSAALGVPHEGLTRLVDCIEFDRHDSCSNSSCSLRSVQSLNAMHEWIHRLA